MLSRFTKAGSSVAVIIPSADLKKLGIKAKDYKDYSFDLRINEDIKSVTLSDFKTDVPPEDIIPNF